ncbi:MAG: hypothetical protein L0271_10665 [Gemmatimonadetes bacterium]|nr:hypothetical protein [Gemmatimonadota bacterium]
MRWWMHIVGCALILLGAGAGLAGGVVAGCAETVEGGPFTGELMGSTFTYEQAGSNAVRIDRVGFYRLNDGNTIRLVCESWMVYGSGGDVLVIPMDIQVEA